MNVYDPGARFDIDALVPDPGVVTPPGSRVSTQVPVDGKSFKRILPVGVEQVVCVIAPTVGAEGVAKIVTDVVAVVIPQPPEAAIV